MVASASALIAKPSVTPPHASTTLRTKPPARHARVRQHHSAGPPARRAARARRSSHGVPRRGAGAGGRNGGGGLERMRLAEEKVGDEKDAEDVLRRMQST